MATDVIPETERDWPELPWHDWAETLATVHMWTQVIGKLRLALSPPLNHWWHVPLYVTTRGLTTSPIPYRDRTFDVDFDFIAHRLVVRVDDGRSVEIALGPKSVARFYNEVMDGLRGLGIGVRIWARPVEVVEAIPFEADEQHASYDRDHATALWRGFARADRVLKAFQIGFTGKASPVHFFWGGFDLATSRYSGRPAPRHPGGMPNCADWVMEEAMSREETAHGWWPLNTDFGPAFYAYTYPEPSGFPSATVAPDAAFYDTRLGEFILPYDAVRTAHDPDVAALQFLETTYAAGATLSGWDQTLLEPSVRPGVPPRRAWSTAPPG